MSFSEYRDAYWDYERWACDMNVDEIRRELQLLRKQTRNPERQMFTGLMDLVDVAHVPRSRNNDATGGRTARSHRPSTRR